VIVLAIDESEKAAHKRSRRVLSKWLCQIGSRTWKNNLSNEGLEQMVSELKKVSSKNTAVAIYVSKSSRRVTKYCVCGSGVYWDEEGRYSHKLLSALWLLIATICIGKRMF